MLPSLFKDFRKNLRFTLRPPNTDIKDNTLKINDIAANKN